MLSLYSGLDLRFQNLTAKDTKENTKERKVLWNADDADDYDKK